MLFLDNNNRCIKKISLIKFLIIKNKHVDTQERKDAQILNFSHFYKKIIGLEKTLRPDKNV